MRILLRSILKFFHIVTKCISCQLCIFNVPAQLSLQIPHNFRYFVILNTFFEQISYFWVVLVDNIPSTYPNFHNVHQIWTPLSLNEIQA